jgi:hypothetical protein
MSALKAACGMCGPPVCAPRRIKATVTCHTVTGGVAPSFRRQWWQWALAVIVVAAAVAPLV